MASVNDVTGDPIRTKTSEQYRNNYDSIFRKKDESKESQQAVAQDVASPEKE